MLFKELIRNLNLQRMIGSKLGTMYFQPDLPADKDEIVRHFDSELSSNYTGAYASLYTEIAKWVKSKPGVSQYVYAQELIEVGEDYTIRPFQIYDISISDYFDEDESVETPELFDKMKDAVLKELDRPGNEKEMLIQNVVKKSLIEKPTKTFFEDKIGKFIIVEPSISVEDVKAWYELAKD